jgi:hypothetical protein
MGANAQTSVPLFVANNVLTAAQQNISAATGVPVFATTVTRDAAFGGSNKVLAEGQLAYIEASDVVQYYTGAAWATLAPTASKIVQMVSGSTSTTVSNSTTTFADTGLTATITPTLNTSKILVMVVHGTNLKTSANSGSGVNIKLFRGATQIAYNRGGGVMNVSADLYFTTSFLVDDNPATTSATTYKTTFANEVAAASVSVQALSGLSTIVLMEVLA